MAKRRANNEGTVYKRTNKGWRAQVTINGQRLSYTAKTQKECQDWLKETIQQINQGFTYEGANTTVKEFLTNWLVSISSSRSKGTITLYQRTVNKEILPILGQLKLTDLKPDLIQRFYDHKIKNGQSAHAVHTAHKVLNIAIQHAVRLGCIVRNPCKETVPPKPEQTEMQSYDENQVQTLLTTSQVIKDKYYPLYYLAIHTGMRQAELFGLKWEDLDRERRTLQVHRQVARMKGGGFEFTKPKSKSGNRTITLGVQTVEVLKLHRKQVWELQKKVGDDWTDLNLIFPTRVGTPILGSNLRRGFRKLLKESGLPKIRFHDLRHTAASLMLNYGISVLIVSRRLGHSKPSITLDVYGHLIPSKQEEAAELMDELLAPIDTTNCTLFAPK